MKKQHVSTACVCSKEEKGCTGDAHACVHLDCKDDALCTCTVNQSISNLVYATAELYPVVVLRYTGCLSRYRIVKRLKRALKAESESPLDVDGDILTSGKTCNLTLRKQGIEFMTKIDRHHPIKMPKALVLQSGKLKAILLAADDRIYSSEFHIVGLHVCELIDCIFCFRSLENLDCLPPVLKMFIYALFGSIVIVALAYLRAAIMRVIDALRWILFALNQGWRVFKALLRLSLK